MVQKSSSGFQKDSITGGITTIKRLSDGAFDILIIDARKTVISMAQDGGKILMIRKGDKDATFLHYFPGKVIEIYSIWLDKEGKAKFSLLQSKGGDDMRVHKSSVLVGDCDSIDFQLIN